jgi:hypothetical protein
MKNAFATVAAFGFAYLAMLAPVNAAVAMKVVQGTSCTPAAAPIPITTTGGTVTVSVCVTTTLATEAVCSAGFPLVATNASGIAAGVSVTTRTNTAPLTVTQDVTALPATLNGTAVQFGNSVPGSGVQAGGTGANVKVAEFVLAVPSGLAAGTSFNFGIDASGEIGLRDATKTDCNDLTGTISSNPPGPGAFSLVTPGVVAGTAPTVNPLAAATLTAGTGTVPVTVATAGTATASLGLSCSIPATAPSNFAITAGATRTINAPAATGANAPAIGLSCVPQAAAVNATLTCTQTPTPAAVLPDLTATITCPAAIVATPSVSVSVTPTTLVDAAANVATFTFTSSAAAPAGGLSVNFTPPTVTGLIASTTCVSPIVIPTAATTATCTLTAAVNTTPGDGPTTGTATVLAATGGVYTIGTASASVTVNDNDVAVTPVVSVGASPATIGDSGGTITITFTASPAPTAPLSVNFTPPTVGGLIASTTCTSPIVIAASATTATCTVTAAANTVAGDGSTSSAVTLLAGTGYTISTSGNGAVNIAVIDDDAVAAPTVAIPVMGALGLGLMSLLIAGFAGFAQRRRMK